MSRWHWGVGSGMTGGRCTNKANPSHTHSQEQPVYFLQLHAVSSRGEKLCLYRHYVITKRDVLKVSANYLLLLPLLTCSFDTLDLVRYFQGRCDFFRSLFCLRVITMSCNSFDHHCANCCWNCCTKDKKRTRTETLHLTYFFFCIRFDRMGYFTFTTHAAVSSNKPQHSFSFCSNPAAWEEAAAARIKAFYVHLRKPHMVD